MLLQDIKPFVRFARYLRIGENSTFYRNVPLDARLFYALEGEGTIDVEGELLRLTPGTALFLPAGQPYHIQPGNVVYIAVNFDFTQIRCDLLTPVEPIPFSRAQKPELVESVRFADAVCFNGPCLCRELLDLRQDLRKLENAYVKKLPFHSQETSGRLAAVLVCMARQASRRVSRGNRFDIEAIMEYIRSHLHEQLDNQTLARRFHFHPNYISAEFKNTVGQSLHSYVLETRILHAVAQMEAGQRDVSQIAQSCGFSSVNYFTRYFKKRLGVTPGAYMRRGKPTVPAADA